MSSQLVEAFICDCDDTHFRLAILLISAALLLVSCGHANSDLTNGTVKLKFVNASDTNVNFVLENGAQDLIRIQGWAASKEHDAFEPARYSMSCYSKQSPEARTALPSFRHGPKSKIIDVFPKSRLQLSITVFSLGEYKSSRCHLDLDLEGGSRLRSEEFVL